MPSPERIREAIPNVFLSSVYEDQACTARVISSGGQLEYKVIMLRDLEQNQIWGSCDCKWFRAKGSVTFSEKWCKHLHATAVVWDRELTQSKRTGASPSQTRA